MVRTISIIITFIALSIQAHAQVSNQAISFTLDDRDRIIKLEADVSALRNEMGSFRNEMGSLRNEMGSLRHEMDARLDAVNSKIDYIFWMLGVIVALIIFILGYMIWDRRTALYPVKEKGEQTSGKISSVINVLRDFSQTNQELANILRSRGLL